MSDAAPSLSSWFVYLLACEDGSLYAGVTTDPARRLHEHQTGRGARYTRARGAARLVWLLEADGRSEALRLEAAVKRLPRQAKLLLGGEVLEGAAAVRSAAGRPARRG